MLINEDYMQEELFDVVDREDNIIHSGLGKTELHLNNDITRVATIFVFDRDGYFYIAQRSPKKQIEPLKFEAPAHGRVSSGEGYEQTARRETKEELGVELDKLEEVDHFYFAYESNVGIRQHYKKLYIGYTSGDIVPDNVEIHDIKKFSNIEEYFEFYDTETHLFSQAQEVDIIRLKKYFNYTR